jgi:hypothetical protein
MFVKTKSSVLFGILVALFFLISISSDAQWNKGDWLVEGGLGNLRFTSNKLDKNYDGYNVNFNVGPNVGYFITKNLVGGASLQLTCAYLKTGRSVYDATSNTTQFLYAIGMVYVSPFIRCYIPSTSLRNKFYFQVEGGSGVYFLRKNKYSNYDSAGHLIASSEKVYTTNNPGYTAAGLFGFQHFISNTIAIHTNIGYYYQKVKQTTHDRLLMLGGAVSESYSTTQTYVYSNIWWNLGFTFILPSNKK